MFQIAPGEEGLPNEGDDFHVTGTISAISDNDFMNFLQLAQSQEPFPKGV